MFKKSLVALAVSGVVAATVNAADITTTTKDISIQGVASLDTVRSNTIEVDLEREYSFGDILTFTWVGGEVDPDDLPVSVDVLGPGGAGLMNPGDTMTLGLLGTSTTGAAVYRVTELDTALGGTTIGGTVTLAAVDFDTATVLSSGTVSVSFSSVTGAGAIAIEGPEEGDLFTTSDQYDASVETLLDGIIDVESDREAFESPAVNDVLEFSTVDDSALDYAATGGLFTVTLNGSFDFLDSDAKTDGIQLTGTPVTPAPDSVTSTAIVWEDVAEVTDLAVTITPYTGSGANELPAGSFTVDVSVDYTDFGDVEAGGGTTAAGDEDLVQGAAGGAWVLNGSVVEVPYMPMGPNTQPILRHTNTGVQTGDITMRYMVEGEHTTWQDGGTLVAAAEPGLTNILSQTEAALLADGYDRSMSGFKVALEITTNVPAADVTVFAAAKVSAEGQDRLTVGAFSN